MVRKARFLPFALQDTVCFITCDTRNALLQSNCVCSLSAISQLYRQKYSCIQFTEPKESTLARFTPNPHNLFITHSLSERHASLDVS